MTLIGKFIEFKGQFLDSAINQPFKIVKFKLSKTNELAGTIDESETSEIEDIINDNSPLTDEQILWVKQYLSQYVDENVIEVIITALSALSIVALIAFYFIKLVKSVNGGLKLKTQETSTFNEIASNGVQELTNAVLALKTSLKEQLDVNTQTIKQSTLQNEKIKYFRIKV